MAVLGGSFVAAALLLGLGGALEVWRPATTLGALRAMGLPASVGAVRLGGVCAAVMSLGAVVSLSRPFALAVSVSYLLLGGFVLAALARDVPLQSCGCFGRQDTPPTVGHLVLDVAAAVVAGVVALAPGTRGWASLRLDPNPVTMSVFAVLTVAATVFTYLALTTIPHPLAGSRTRQRPT